MWNDEDNNPYGTSFTRGEEDPSSPESAHCTLPSPTLLPRVFAAGRGMRRIRT